MLADDRRGHAAARSTRRGAAKLLVTSRALRLRRDRPELFTSYAPLDGIRTPRPTTSSRSIAAARSPSPRGCPSGSPRAAAGVTPSSTCGSAPVVDVITGRHHEGGSLRLDDVLRDYPVALLAEEGGKP